MQVTTLLTTETPEKFAAAVEAATEALRHGMVVGLPTETVYGLAANALDPKAVEDIYRVKGRPATNPIIVHVCDVEMAKSCAANWPEQAAKLAGAFWPGPLTMVLPKTPLVPDVVTAGGPTVGIRMPGHSVILEVIRRCGFPLAAPSANPANRISPTTARHVVDYFQGEIPLVIDGGPSQVGIESTVIDLSVSPPRVLRPGMIHEPALEAVIGNLSTGPEGEGLHLKSPGLMRKHYSPRARLRIWLHQKDTAWLASETPANSRSLALCHTRVPLSTAVSEVRMLPRDAKAYARAFYAELHASDETSTDLIWVEEPPDSADWRGIRDRLRRAAS